MSTALAPGNSAGLGVIGGGQLGRMFVQAAQVLGYRTVVLDPDVQSPAGLVAQTHLASDYLDEAGLAALASVCSAVTTEFENVPARALQTLAARVTVSPAAESVEVCQDRAAEKLHFKRSGVPCAPFALIASDADLQASAVQHLLPGILKTTRLGYDGKGQQAVASAAALGPAWQALKRAPCVLEKRLPLRLEISVIVARADSGQIVHLPVQQNLHRDGILAVTTVPAPDVDASIQAQALECAQRLAASLNYVGVLCVEFFVLSDGSLVANEMAPRPHNSGHYSLDACDLSQFDLQVRTLARLPLVAPRLHSPAIMLNLLGDLWFAAGASAEVEPDWASVLALPGVHLHLYGKAQARPGRKMGHLTVTAADAATARDVALQAAALLHLPPF